MSAVGMEMSVQGREERKREQHDWAVVVAYLGTAELVERSRQQQPRRCASALLAVHERGE